MSRRVGALVVASTRLVMLGHASLLAAQPFLAGAALDGTDPTSLSWHAGVGGGLLLVSLIQLPLACLAWRPGHWPAWPIGVSLLLWVAEIVQLSHGRSGTLAVHVPLGVAVVAVGVASAVWSLGDRATLPSPAALAGELTAVPAVPPGGRRPSPTEERP